MDKSKNDERNNKKTGKDGLSEYEVIKGYNVESDEIENETIKHTRVLWNSRQRYEILI